jgi:hypothetical protein
MEGHRRALIVELLLYFQGAGAVVPNVDCLVIAAGDNELLPDTHVKTSDLGYKIRNLGFMKLARHVTKFSLDMMFCVFSNIDVCLQQLALISYHVDRVFV